MSSSSLLLEEEGGGTVEWYGDGNICASPVARASYAPLDDGEDDSTLISLRRVSSSMGATSAAARRGGTRPSALASAGAASALHSVGRRIASAVESAKEQRSGRVRQAALEKQVANNAKFMANLLSEEDRVFAEIAQRKEQERRDAELAVQLGAEEASRAAAALPPQRSARGGLEKQLRVRVLIPQGTPHGGRFLVDLPGHGRIQVDAPPGTSAGDEIQFVVPARASGDSAATAARAQRMAPRPEDVAAMVMMGFSRRLCTRALAEPSSGGSRCTVADATEWLLEHLDSLECEGAEQEQRTAAATAAAEVAAAAHGGAASAPPMPPPPAAALAAAAAAAAPPPNEALARLQTAKAMLDARLITAEEYAATKRDILAALAAGGAASAAAPSPLPPPAADLLDLL